jgi:hypothetical protein
MQLQLQFVGPGPPDGTQSITDSSDRRQSRAIMMCTCARDNSIATRKQEAFRLPISSELEDSKQNQKSPASKQRATTNNCNKTEWHETKFGAFKTETGKDELDTIERIGRPHEIVQAVTSTMISVPYCGKALKNFL